MTTKGVGCEDMQDLVGGLHRIFGDGEINTEEVMDLMSSYKSNPLDWRKYAKFDTHKYTRNLVDEGNGKFNLMILCWGEGMGSSVHDHANSHCFVKILSGVLRETQYEWPKEGDDSPLRVKEVNNYSVDQVTYINDSIGLHRVENPSHTDGAVSLHLYCPPFNKCLTFDERTGHKRVCPVTFWTRFGERTQYKVPPSAVCGETS